MSRPIPGKKYTVEPGDTLSSISNVAYGDPSQWPIIHSTNQSSLKSSDPNLIFPGEVLIIPELEVIKQAKDSLTKRSRSSDVFEIEINGRIIPILAGTIIRTMDTAADAWAASIEWEPGRDEFIDIATSPYSYATARAYINGERLVTGSLFESNPTLDSSGSKKDLAGFSSTINIVDSDLRPGDYEDNNISLKERAEKLLKPYGLRVVIDPSVLTKANVKFDRVTADRNDKIFDHLADLASQRQILVSSTEKGNLLLTQANTSSRPVGTVEEDASTASLSYQAKFDGRKRFSIWRVDCQTPFKTDKKNGISKDLAVPIMRYKNVTKANDTRGGIEQTAQWIKSKEFAKSLQIPFPFPSFFSPDGSLWRENTKVIVKSKTIGVPNGFEFLIRQVEYKRTSQGDSVVLGLVPPQVYTGETIIEPWRIT